MKKRVLNKSINHRSAPECDQTFSEKMMLLPNIAAANKGLIVDWDFELFEIKRHPEQTHRWKKLKLASAQWTTCACGHTCAIIPRDLTGKPEDGELSTLGALFTKAIEDEDRPEARHLLNEIEKRSNQLVREILASQKGEDHGQTQA